MEYIIIKGEKDYKKFLFIVFLLFANIPCYASSTISASATCEISSNKFKKDEIYISDSMIIYDDENKFIGFDRIVSAFSQAGLKSSEYKIVPSGNFVKIEFLHDKEYLIKSILDIMNLDTVDIDVIYNINNSEEYYNCYNKALDTANKRALSQLDILGVKGKFSNTDVSRGVNHDCNYYITVQVEYLVE